MGHQSYVLVKWPVFRLQRGSAKSPIAPSNFSPLCLDPPTQFFADVIYGWSLVIKMVVTTYYFNIVLSFLATWYKHETFPCYYSKVNPWIVLETYNPRCVSCSSSISWEHSFTTKGQIISECPYDIIVSPKIPTKKFPRFLP